MIASMSQGSPYKCVGTTARVAGVIARSSDAGSRVKVAGSMSAKTTFKPATCAMERDYTWLRADFPAGFGWMTQDLHASGAVGDATVASAEKGEAALDHGAKAFVELLKDVERFALAALADGPLD